MLRFWLPLREPLAPFPLNIHNEINKRITKLLPVRTAQGSRLVGIFRSNLGKETKEEGDVRKGRLLCSLSFCRMRGKSETDVFTIIITVLFCFFL
ncbi:hypothetical protein XELAEV_18036491mg [Xenopus laevis]|uniref:Uncharacterized protein n=1 Tax=Xenopus laevis TaxID=8355 RepID=A0A974CI03_XENLA|nr:hypothetical protein XELAEV_18036491mg [Xenopus laevis]